MTGDHLAGDDSIYLAIESDPRYQSEIRPQLVNAGFVFHNEPGKYELYYVKHTSQATGDQRNNPLIWNSIMQSRKAHYLDDAVYQPASAYYPHVNTPITAAMR